MTKRDTVLVLTVFIAAFAGAASWQLYQEYRVRSALESFFQSTANMFKSLTAEERKKKAMREEAIAKKNKIEAEKEAIRVARINKRKAFNSWYKTPKECLASRDNPNPNVVNCTNQRMKAWPEFSNIYDGSTRWVGTNL